MILVMRQHFGCGTKQKFLNSNQMEKNYDSLFELDFNEKW